MRMHARRNVERTSFETVLVVQLYDGVRNTSVVSLGYPRAMISRLVKRVATWQVLGLFWAVVAMELRTLLRLGLRGWSPRVHLLLAFVDDTAFWTLVTAVMMLPLTLLTLFVWARWAGLVPALERRLVVMITGLVFVAALLALATGSVNNWEYVVSIWLPARFLSNTLDSAGRIFPGVVAGLVLPRLTARSLRLGAFRGESQ
jgi:hypothetical protein